MTGAVVRTDPARVTGAHATSSVPRSGRTVSGYGGRIPTRYVIRYAGRWRRVRVMAYGNSGSAYVVVDGRPLFLDADTEHRLANLPTGRHCPDGCGATREIVPGDPFPAHPDRRTLTGGRFSWCAGGDMSGALVNIPAVEPSHGR